MSETARTAYRLGIEHERAGRRLDALQAYRDAAQSSPDFVEAHRAYQNLSLAWDRRGQMIEEYRAHLAAAPGSAPRRYLLARLWSDPRRQLAGFETALDADPNLYFGHVGAGYVCFELGDFDRAEAEFRRAIELAADRPEARAGLMQALNARRNPGDKDEIERLASGALARDPTDAIAMRILLERKVERLATPEACADAVTFALRSGGADAAALARDLLAARATAADFESARARIAAADPRAFDSLPWLELRALVEERCGDPEAALQVVRRAPPELADGEAVSELRRRLLLRCGEFESWLAEIAERRYQSGLDLGDGGAAARRLEEVRALCRAAGGAPVGSAAASAVEGLLWLGLVDGAIALAGASLDLEPGDAAVLRLRAEGLRHRRFVAETRELFLSIYRGDVRPDLDGAIAALRKLSVSCLGEDVVEPVVLKDFAPIGAFLDPDPASGSGLARYFDRFGAFCVLGQRAFAPPECYLLTRIAAGRRTVAGEDVYRVIGEDLQIESRVEDSGGEIAGFAFQSFFVLNADRARATASNARALYRAFRRAGIDPRTDALLAADSDAARRDVGEPLSLETRSTWRAYDAWLARGGAPERYAGEILESVEAHESAHIRDAAQFLPVFADLGAKLQLLLRHGFRPQRVEAWLEQRAQVGALADAASPLAVLASTAALSPDENAAPPHSIGYNALLEELVAVVDDAPDAFPTVDRRFALLGQLDRLGDDGLREAARRLQQRERDRDLTAPRSSPRSTP